MFRIHTNILEKKIVILKKFILKVSPKNPVSSNNIKTHIIFRISIKMYRWESSGAGKQMNKIEV